MNQSDLRDFISCSQDLLDDLFPGTIQLGGVSYDVTIMGTERSGGYNPGFHEDEREIKFRIRKSLHPTEPKLGEKVIYEGYEYKITTVAPRPYDNVAWHVTAPNYNAVE